MKRMKAPPSRPFLSGRGLSNSAKTNFPVDRKMDVDDFTSQATMKYLHRAQAWIVSSKIQKTWRMLMLDGPWDAGQPNKIGFHLRPKGVLAGRLTI